MALTNRQQRNEDDRLVELLRRIDGHPVRHDLIRDVHVCQTYTENPQFLTVTKEGLMMSRLRKRELPQNAYEWTEAQWSGWNANGVISERVQDYGACVEIFRGLLFAEQLETLLTQLDE
jgi:hypothetical protein